MEPITPPLPLKPQPPKPAPPAKPRGWLAILLLGCATLAFIIVMTFLTLGFFGPIVVLGLAVFGIIGLQYLLWGWWFERIYRSGAATEELPPTDRPRGLG